MLSWLQVPGEACSKDSGGAGQRPLFLRLCRASDKLFLLDQCEKYRRCKQCQRRTSNRGESNLWPLNKYMHGSRLFV